LPVFNNRGSNRFTFWICQDGNTLEWFCRMLFWSSDRNAKLPLPSNQKSLQESSSQVCL
jgi:hypothetical protein